MRDRERHVRVLLDEQHRHALLVDVLDRLEDELDEHRGEPHRRLVEQQHDRSRHERASDREHLLLAARQRAGALREALLEAWEELVDALEVLRDLRWGIAPRIGAHLEVLFHRHTREDPPALGRVREAEADDLVRRHLREVAVAHPDGALPRAQDTGDRSQRRRLPGAVAADERYDLALAHRERGALQRLDVAVVGVDLLDLEERHQATWSTMRPSPSPDTPR